MYIKIKKMLNSNKFTVGLWNYKVLSKSIPHTREGASGVCIKNKLFIFGGFSNSLYNDLREIDLITDDCDLVEPNSLKPIPRCYHTMVNY